MRIFSALFLALCLAPPAFAQRQMERLDRGVVAVNQGGGRVFVSWRLLGTDPEEAAFDVYRLADDAPLAQLNDAPVANVTSLLDESAPVGQRVTYVIRATGEPAPQAPATEAPLGAHGDRFTLKVESRPLPYVWFPITPPFGYRPNDTSAGDLDGDGQYELVIHMVGSGRDNSQVGDTTPPWLFAYKLDGTLLWKINLGRNIREGAHYTQYMVYDLDGDGRA